MKRPFEMSSYCLQSEQVIPNWELEQGDKKNCKTLLKERVARNMFDYLEDNNYIDYSIHSSYMFEGEGTVVRGKMVAMSKSELNMLFQYIHSLEAEVEKRPFNSGGIMKIREKTLDEHADFDWREMQKRWNGMKDRLEKLGED